jgi:ACS family hexuronate transporter-like MFS transporter
MTAPKAPRQDTAASPIAPAGQTRFGHGWYRWVICGLLFFATTINYMDRQVIGVLKPKLEESLHWSDADYGHIVLCFQAAYAAGYLFGGRLMDQIGVRLGLTLSVALWSIAAAAHGLVRSVVGFAAARAGLGLAEGGNFPASIKIVGQWFPKRERALATGIFNAGSNVGAVLTPLAAPWIAENWGWPAAFYTTGALGLAWLVLWIPIYAPPEKHPRVSPRELDYIRSDPTDPAVHIPWLELLRHRQTWAFVLGMFVTSPIWWFYLYWVPDFFHKTHHLKLLELGPPLVIIYLMADVGSIGGGWLSSTLLARGWSVNAARKTAMLVCALCVVPVSTVSTVSNVWLATALIGLAASAHQGFSANLFTLVSDTTPGPAVSSVVGIGGMAAGIGGMLSAELVGQILERTKHYFIPFVAASSGYLVALWAIHLLLPKLEPMQLSRVLAVEKTVPSRGGDD